MRLTGCRHVHRGFRHLKVSPSCKWMGWLNSLEMWSTDTIWNGTVVEIILIECDKVELQKICPPKLGEKKSNKSWGRKRIFFEPLKSCFVGQRFTVFLASTIYFRGAKKHLFVLLYVSLHSPHHTPKKVVSPSERSFFSSIGLRHAYVLKYFKQHYTLKLCIYFICKTEDH